MEHNFNVGVLKEYLKTLQALQVQRIQLEEEIERDGSIIANDNAEFDRELMFYRQKLITAKYYHMESITRACRTAKESLVEILTYLHEFMKSSKELFEVNKDKG